MILLNYVVLVIILMVSLLVIQMILFDAFGQTDTNMTNTNTNMTNTNMNMTIIPTNMTIIPTNMTIIPTNMTDVENKVNTVIGNITDTIDEILEPETKSYLYTISTLSGLDINRLEHIITSDEEIMGTMNLRWERADDMVITSVSFGEFNDWLTVPNMPYSLKLDDGKIDYKLSLPMEVCDSSIIVSCIKESIYSIPVKINGKADGKPFTLETDMIVDVKGYNVMELLSMLLIPISIILAVILTKKRKKRSNFYKDLVSYK